MNGGRADLSKYDIQRQASSWLLEFADEMSMVRSRLVGQEDNKYYKIAKASKESKNGGEGDKGLHNLLGSAINLLLCDIENSALMAMREFVESAKVRRRVGTLMFDGLMFQILTAFPLKCQRVSCSNVMMVSRSKYRRLFPLKI
jgi:hypothetical protein